VAAGRHAKMLAAAVIAAAALGAAGCGDGGEGGDAVSDVPAPPASDFPPAQGKTLNDVLRDSKAARSDLVVSPAGAVFETGQNRFGFGVFTVSREQVLDARVAIYAAPAGGGQAVGPFPASVESLEVKPQFQSQTTANDPDAAKVVYVSNVEFDRAGNWDLVALFRNSSGYSATLIPTIEVGGYDRIPAVGEPAPRIHTPTPSDVGGDLSEIDTRSPHDDMHDDDFADVVGEEPVVLLFATPALCVSRVCGPVVDIEQQVKSEVGDAASFIHMEVYNDNNASEGLRPQLKAFGLPTEPWLFVMDRNGIVRTRTEGAFSPSELQDAVQRVTE
jgi:hypothetical protein